MKKRIEEVAPGITSEVIALQTTMLYDPNTGDAQIIFAGTPCLFNGSTYVGPGGGAYPISLTLSAIAQECFGEGLDPITGADLSKVSVLGAVSLIKAAFAKSYDAAYDAPPPIEA
ncbi:hypothetical protein ACQKIE_18690 [Luteibacter sp. NPDC031894]|uniref:hypothetical protein n=1 Tax=Luteibacter sp. NPDC031894 TaxID=3390572 RepID=UPI003D07B1E1